ncbi:hypothetical protein AGDE_10614 [Angomonas deanei]|uniref:CorA-like Mg2+ transporter protein, putative n=1 Tax=Angomonas deanei TaxID=59799 RepID=A0A7G2C3E9_9TRYP|nr:hypothetical protein AGDE_10614 [Angomonas deanei]CAD2213671.1 CorA-like Mg2+ transporter protein, putative [Angomonas deanei]|eukprot:EPY27974.1 hypothetical protein AGDE_10614 [Angomonas deanei]
MQWSTIIVREATAGGAMPLVVPMYVVVRRGCILTWSPFSDGNPTPPEKVSFVIPNWGNFQETLSSALQTAVRGSHTAVALLHLLQHNFSLFLPAASPIISDVDNVDSLLPYITPEKESDQVDALRRVLLLRRKINAYKKYLMYKVRMLEALETPAIRLVVPFLQLDSMTEGKTGGLRYGRLRERLQRTLGQLQEARGVLANTTLLYSTTVVSTSSAASTDTDLYQLFVSYVLIITLPMSIIASHWGMNCMVPFKHTDSTTPFWVITAVMAGVGILLTGYVSAMYCGGEKRQARLS